MLNGEKKHIYSLTFLTPGMVVKSIYMGLEKNRITIPDLDRAKKDCEVDPDSALIASTYMGRMTWDDLKGV